MRSLGLLRHWQHLQAARHRPPLVLGNLKWFTSRRWMALVSFSVPGR